MKKFTTIYVTVTTSGSYCDCCGYISDYFTDITICEDDLTIYKEKSGADDHFGQIQYLKPFYPVFNYLNIEIVNYAEGQECPPCSKNVLKLKELTGAYKGYEFVATLELDGKKVLEMIVQNMEENSFSLLKEVFTKCFDNCVFETIHDSSYLDADMWDDDYYDYEGDDVDDPRDDDDDCENQSETPTS